MCVLSRHGGVFVRWFELVLIVLVAIFAAGSTNLIAMEEQRGALPAGVPVPDAPKAQEQEESLPSKSDSGTEIRIPGLGKIGTLPKMDFGLDLLYGAAEDGTKAAPEFTSPQDDEQRDLMIHGTVKHRF
ncbi:MAG: hypothetical protein JSR99_08855 [Proteobacteria bacterium]|nr:hypothetical protein [Pseudomonadota bacterium]